MASSAHLRLLDDWKVKKLSLLIACCHVIENHFDWDEHDVREVEDVIEKACEQAGTDLVFGAMSIIAAMVAEYSKQQIT